MSKWVTLIGWDDAPHLRPPHVSQEELDELEATMLPHQRAARKTGKPDIGPGAIYPINLEDLLIDPIPIPDWWERGWALDVGWRKTAALIGARDPDTNMHYLTGEYYLGEQEPIVHAHAIKQMLPWSTLEGVIDPGAKGSSQRDGKKLKQEYEDLGLVLRSADNAVTAGLTRCLTLMQSGLLKVFNTMTYFRREFALYRRDEKGEIVKTNDHLMDDMRYLLFTDDAFISKPMERARAARRGREF